MKGKFSVTADGAATYTMPLPVPPGRVGLQPKLSVTYNSEGGETHLGVGWSLSGFSAIHRCGSTIAQDGHVKRVQFNTDDHFCLGGQRLIPISGPSGANASIIYHTENESYSRIISYGSSPKGPDYFKVLSKDGLVRFYGCDSEYPMYSERGNCDALMFARDDVIHGWTIKEVRDRLDNYMIYHYDRWDDQLSNDYNFDGVLEYVGNPETVEILPTMIEYTGKRTPPSAQPPQRSIRFEYEHRTEPVKIGYFAGVRTRLSRRLSKIRTFGPGPSLAHMVKLTYEVSSSTRRKRLSKVELCDNQDVCIPPTQFEWKSDRLTPGGSYTLPESIIPAGSEIRSLVSLDVNGDGLSDLAYIREDTWRLLISTGNTIPFDAEIDTGINGVTEDEGGVKYDVAVPLDYDGDGMDDLIVSTWDGDFLRNLISWGTTLYEQWFRDLKTSPRNWYPLDTYVKFADINGDGLQDYLFCDASASNISVYWQYRLNSGSGFNPSYQTGIACMEPAEWPGESGPLDPYELQ